MAKGSKKSTAKSSTRSSGTLSDATVSKVVKLRTEGKSWDEVLEATGLQRSQVPAIRNAMRAVDPGSIRRVGRAASNGGNGASRKSSARGSKKATTKRPSAKKSTSKRSTRKVTAAAE